MSERLGELMRWLKESLHRDEEMSKTLRSLSPSGLSQEEPKVTIPQNKSFEELMRALADCMESSIEAIDRVTALGAGDANVSNTDGPSQK